MLRKRNQKCQQKQGRGKGLNVELGFISKRSAFKAYKKTLENGERQS